MKTITSESTIGEIVRSTPARARVFENLGIDCFCGGKRPLVEACQSKGLNHHTVIAELLAIQDTSVANPVNSDSLNLSELCDHIEQFYHAYLCEELPRLEYMTRKVATVHGDREPRLLEVRRVFEIFNAQINAQTTEQDETLFPAIRLLDSGNGWQAVISFMDSFTKLESEHVTAGDALAQLRKLTDNYVPPDWACSTFRALYNGLEELEKKTHQHVHIENDILFRKVLVALRQRSDSSGATDDEESEFVSPVCYLNSSTSHS